MKSGSDNGDDNGVSCIDNVMIYHDTSDNESIENYFRHIQAYGMSDASC